MSKGDKRQQIMKAAEGLFTSRRFHEITVDDVARAAHVGKGTIYQYFADKDDLFFQVATSGFDELCELLRRKVHGDAPFAGQLIETCTEIVSFFEARRQLFRMMQAEGARILWCKGELRQRWVEKRRQLVGAVAEILQRGADEGAVRPDVPADVLATFLLGMLRTRAHDLAEAAADVQRLELLLDLFLGGARRAAAAPEPATTRPSADPPAKGFEQGVNS